MASDIRNAKTYKSSTEAKRAAAVGVTEQFWWNSEVTDTERHKKVIALAKQLENTSQERHQTNLRHARMYENVEVESLIGSDYAAGIMRQALQARGIIRMNVIAAAEDTLCAKISKNKPRPSYTTSGGQWSQQQKARRLDKFQRGSFYEMKIHKKGKKVFQDACTFGTGLMHFFYNENTDRIDCERVLPDEIFVDDNDAMYDAPRQLLRRKFMAREVLLGMFPKLTEEIFQFGFAKSMDSYSVKKEFRTPMVEVWESWHLPSKKGAKDGMHCICIDGAELLCEPWTEQRFPFVKMVFKERTVGFWGKGVAESLVGIQIEINRLILSISEQLRRKGRGRIFLRKGSGVNPSHITNGIADIVEFTGEAPIIDNQNAIAAEEFMQLDRLYRQAFQEIGASELSVASRKPSGLDAAVALREFSDIESERFALVHQNWEDFFMECAEVYLMLVRMYKPKGYKVRMPNKRFVIELDWVDIGLAEDAYVVQVFPVSSLPQTPAARYQKVTELMQDGFIDKPTAQRLLEFPDLEAEGNLGNAAIDDADAVIGEILDNETPKLIPLEPYQNIDLIISRGTAAYLYARHHGAEEERLAMLRDLIDSATQMKADMTQASLPPPMPGAGAPGMPPGGPGIPGAPQAGLPISPSPGPMGPGPAPTVPPVIA